MSKAQTVFEALMRSKGHTDFNMNTNGKYGWTPPSEKIIPPPVVSKEPAWITLRRMK
jgi:hypothetical protein